MGNQPLKVVCIDGWSHAYMVLDEMLAMPEASLCAVAPTWTGEDLSSLADAECEDHAVIAGRLDNGAHASISIDMVRPDATDLPSDDWIRPRRLRRCMIEANASKGSCEITAEHISQRPLPLPEEGQMFRQFLLSLRDGRETPPSTEDSFMLTHTALVARDNADAGAPRSAD